MIGTRRVKATEMAEIRSHFDIIKMLLVDERRDCCAPSVPAYLKTCVITTDVLSESVDFSRVGIAPHKPHTGYRIFRFTNQCR